MSFLAAQYRLNASVLKCLANARVQIGGEDVAGIFRNPSKDQPLGIGAADTSPVVSVASSAVPENPVDMLIGIDGVEFRIFAHEPDGTGMSVLRVERTQ